MVALVDSVDKIILNYFTVVAREPFTFKGVTYLPKKLSISPLLLRGYTCPAECGGCCPRFSLDYLPGEEMPSQVTARIIPFNGKAFMIFSDLQLDHSNHHCRHLLVNGRCGNYQTRPFTCDFELIRSLRFAAPHRSNILLQRLFGRGWKFLRVDGKRGALCEITPVTEASRLDNLRKLKRLQTWTDYFKIKTWLPEMITLIANDKLHHPITFDPKRKGMI